MQLLRGGASFFSTAKSASAIRAALVCLQIAISVSILAATMFLMDHTHDYVSRPMGADKNALLVSVKSLHAIPDERLAETRNRIERVVQELGSLPGVVSVAQASSTPYSGNVFVNTIPENPLSLERQVFVTHVTPSYFSALGVSMQQGATDATSASGGIVVSRSFADSIGNPQLGVSLPIIDGAGRLSEAPILGIVGDVEHHPELRRTDRPGRHRHQSIPQPSSQRGAAAGTRCGRTSGVRPGARGNAADEDRTTHPESASIARRPTR
jgi:hypothetical protein